MLPAGEISNYLMPRKNFTDEYMLYINSVLDKVKPEFPQSPMNNLGKETKEILNQSQWIIMRMDFTNQ